MKLVKEHIIFEKFTDNNSDPIQDMGIGVKHKIKKLLIKIKKERGLTLNEFEPELLCWAAYHNEFTIVKYLISKGTIIRPKSNYDALCFAAVARNIDIAIFLIENGADLNETIQHAQIHCNTETQRGLEIIKNELNNKKHKK